MSLIGDERKHGFGNMLFSPVTSDVIVLLQERRASAERPQKHHVAEVHVPQVVRVAVESLHEEGRVRLVLRPVKS